MQQNDFDRALLGVYTAYCNGGDGTGLEEVLPKDRTSFFGYARQALAEAIRQAGIRAGDEVLLPGFLCAEITASLSAVGARPRFYEVDEALNARMSSLDGVATTKVRAVIAVNYFGFPQPLESIKSWCQSHGAVLIEDNAHGFLSADGSSWLGRRGDLGVFSLRKTLALPNGAALVDNRPHAGRFDATSYTASRLPAEWRYRSKAVVKQVLKRGNLRSARSLVAGIRAIKVLMNGQVTGPTQGEEEAAMPQEAFAPRTAVLLRRCDVSAERQRRRFLYSLCARVLAEDDRCRAVFPVLPEKVAPFGYPFYFAGGDVLEFQRELFKKGLLSYPWPAHLPEIGAVVPSHYKELLCIAFLW